MTCTEEQRQPRRRWRIFPTTLACLWVICASAGAKANVIDVTHANIIPFDTGSELVVTFDVRAYATTAETLQIPPNPTTFVFAINGAPPPATPQQSLQATLQSDNNMVDISQTFSMQNGVNIINGGPPVPSIFGNTTFSFSVANSIDLFGSDGMQEATIFLLNLGAAISLQVPDFYQPFPCINVCVGIAGVQGGFDLVAGGNVDALTLIQGVDEPSSLAILLASMGLLSGLGFARFMKPFAIFSYE